MTWPIGIQVANLSGDHSFLGIGGWICLCDFWLGYSDLLRSRGHLAELVAFFFGTPKWSKAAENVIINVSICQSVAKIVEFNGDSTTHICHQSTFCTTPKLTYRRNLMVEMVPLQGEHVSFEVWIVLVVVWYRPFNALSPPFTGATKKHRKLPSSSDTILISMENRGFLEFDLCLVGCKSRCSRHLSFSHRDGREPQTCCAVGDVYWSHWRPGKIAGNW